MHEISSSFPSSSSLDDETALVSIKPSGKVHIDDEDLFVGSRPDVLFSVDGIEFPCHLKILSKRCSMLHDIVSVHGIQRRFSKKQRTFKPAERTNYKQEQRPASPCTMTVVELCNIEHKIFRALLEFLYTNEIPSALYWGDMDDGSCLPSGEEKSLKSDQDSTKSQDQSIDQAMRFLQSLLIAADRFDMVSLKHEIEYKLYDEFLYSFTSEELFVWADSHSCAFLKEKAMDRLCKKSRFVDDSVISKEGWTMIRESKRLVEELFLYATHGSHKVSSMSYKNHDADHKNKEFYYYKVEYLRFRLSELGLDVDGTREMLEERLRPHLDVKHRHFLPTKLTKLSLKDTGKYLDQNQKVCFKQGSSSE